MFAEYEYSKYIKNFIDSGSVSRINIFAHCHRLRKFKDHSLITKIIHVADCMVDEMKLEASGEAVPNPVQPKILKELGFGELPVEKFEEDIQDQFNTALSVFL